MLRNELHQRQYKAKALHVETDGMCVSLWKQAEGKERSCWAMRTICCHNILDV